MYFVRSQRKSHCPFFRNTHVVISLFLQLICVGVGSRERASERERERERERGERESERCMHAHTHTHTHTHRARLRPRPRDRAASGVFVETAEIEDIEFLCLQTTRHFTQSIKDAVVVSMTWQTSTAIHCTPNQMRRVQVFLCRFYLEICDQTFAIS